MPTLVRGNFVKGTQQYNNANIAANIIELIYNDLEIKPTNVIFGQNNKLSELKISDGDSLLAAARLELDKIFAELESKNEYTLEMAITLISEKTIEIKYGNCNELSYLFFELAKSYCPDYPIELMMTDTHMFVVIGRDKLSDLKDPTSWGEHCVIADPWARRVMTPAAFQAYRTALKQDIFYRQLNQDIDPVYSAHVKGRFQIYHGIYPKLNNDIKLNKKGIIGKQNG